MPRDPECEVHHHLMGDGRCTCTPTYRMISDESYVKALRWVKAIEWLPRSIAAVKIEVTMLDGREFTYETPKVPE